jgi:hypothetical protein
MVWSQLGLPDHNQFGAKIQVFFPGGASRQGLGGNVLRNSAQVAMLLAITRVAERALESMEVIMRTRLCAALWILSLLLFFGFAARDLGTEIARLASVVRALGGRPDDVKRLRLLDSADPFAFASECRKQLPFSEPALLITDSPWFLQSYILSYYLYPRRIFWYPGYGILELSKVPDWLLKERDIGWEIDYFRDNRARSGVKRIRRGGDNG